MTGMRDQLSPKHAKDEFAKCMQRLSQECQPFYNEPVKVLQGRCGVNTLRDFSLAMKIVMVRLKKNT